MWDVNCSNDSDRPERQLATGFLKMWQPHGLQHRLSYLMMDVLYHLAGLQKEFQKSELLIFDVPVIQDRFVARLKMMESGPYPGGKEECISSSHEPEVNHVRFNSYVTMSSRSFCAIRQEVICGLLNFLERRMTADQTQLLSNMKLMFEATDANEMIARGRNVLTSFGRGDLLQEFTGQCIDIHITNANLAQLDTTLVDRFNVIYSKVKPDTALGHLCNVAASALPHSMAVERAISHYNLFR
jgi:hypothetical protein